MNQLFHMQTLDLRREAIASKTSSKRKSELGQFMTPDIIANFMASMFTSLTNKEIRLLDAGAGIGSLTAAFTERAANDRAKSLECEAWEIDEALIESLEITMDDCADLATSANVGFKKSIQNGDYILRFADIFAGERMLNPTHAILNPPYKKISSASAHRMALGKCGIETSNFYSAFVALALKSLADGGELVAITPRSFCNGTYFRRFRELILERSALVRVHLFESRTQAFKGDEVLQENVIFHLIKGGKQTEVLLTSSSDASFSDLSSRLVPFSEVVLPSDREKVFHLATEINSDQMTHAMTRYSNKLDELGLSVSTGPVVDFRMREHLSEERRSDCAPLIYAHHFQNGFVSHPVEGAKKPNFIQVKDETKKWMMPAGFYVAVRRLSSKEEKRRIVPAVFDPSKVHGDLIGFDNHLNIFHCAKAGISEDVAKGLAVYLGSTVADQWLRRFSGHTQVNAGDLRIIGYPDLDTLELWGSRVGSALPNQEQIDEWVGEVK
jgi:adenine-specific DNA-methyltransferase